MQYMIIGKSYIRIVTRTCLGFTDTSALSLEHCAPSESCVYISQAPRYLVTAINIIQMYMCRYALIYILMYTYAYIHNYLVCWLANVINARIHAHTSRLTVVSREAKKKQHACASSGPRDHYSELFTRMAALKF